MRTATLVLIAYLIMLVVGVVWPALPVPVVDDAQRLVLRDAEGATIYEGGVGTPGDGVCGVEAAASLSL